MPKVVIRASPAYARYLQAHLQREHPKTRGKISVRG
jgi:hypothetical protein